MTAQGSQGDSQPFRLKVKNGTKVISGSEAQNAPKIARASQLQPESFTPSVELNQAQVENPLLAKIKDTLTQTDPDKWKVGGEELVQKIKYPRSLEHWEQVFVLDLPNGTLVLRSSQPVKSDYAAGGYTVKPAGLERYTVEIREKGWNYRELVDPNFRKSSKGGKKCEVLVDGSMAYLLFKEIRGRVLNHSTGKRQEFDQECLDLSAKLLEQVALTTFTSWTKQEKPGESISFVRSFDTLCVEVQKFSSNDGESFNIRFTKGDLVSRNLPSSLAEEVFNAVEELERAAGLQTLSKLIDDAGF